MGTSNVNFVTLPHNYQPTYSMPFTQEQLAKIAQKEASLPDALKRDSLTNYREGYFFVTLNTKDQAPILSYISGRADAADNTPNAPHCVYTDLGKKVMDCWHNIPSFYPSIEILGCEAMPDHFHGLLLMKTGVKAHLGQIIRGFMIGCTHAYWDTLGIEWRPQKGVKTPDCRDRDHTRSLRGPALFVRGYNDTEAITPQQVQTKLQYIHEQARRALIKDTMHDRFLVHRSSTAKGWTLESLHRALLADRYFAHDPARLQSALLAVLKRIPMRHPSTNAATSITATSKPLLSYIGSPDIISTPHKLPLICHRSDAPFFHIQSNAVMRAARGGAVIVSAFISSHERELLKQLLTERLPIIEILDNGFSDRYKPTGKSFYACGENRLMQISPWTYEYNRDTHVTREMCLVMNELARTITGVDEGWWKFS